MLVYSPKEASHRKASLTYDVKHFFPSPLSYKFWFWWSLATGVVLNCFFGSTFSCSLVFVCCYFAYLLFVLLSCLFICLLTCFNFCLLLFALKSRPGGNKHKTTEKIPSAATSRSEESDDTSGSLAEIGGLTLIWPSKLLLVFIPEEEWRVSNSVRASTNMLPTSGCLAFYFIIEDLLNTLGTRKT